MALLDLLMQWVDEIPPLETPQRFGNKAFAIWLNRLEEQAFSLHASLLPIELHASIPELLGYFTNAFGNGIRIDYGSGHEMSFVAWLCCLDILGFFTPQDTSSLILNIFQKYLLVVRKLQKIYVLEPAGSHGNFYNSFLKR